MADFVQTMKDWHRMCAGIHCAGCEIYDYCEGVPNADADKIQRIVTAWAAEHPVVYPTWWEWLASIGAVTRKVTPDAASTLIDTGVLDPIPADIAQKMGIEPKEG